MGKKLTAVQHAERAITKAKTAKRSKAVAVSTVNVLELETDYDSIVAVRVASFLDDEAGNKAAEALFSEWVRRVDPNAYAEDIEDALDNGMYETASSNTVFIITHSTEPTK